MSLGKTSKKTVQMEVDMSTTKSRKSKNTRKTQTQEIGMTQEIEYPSLSTVVFSQCQINNP